MSKFVWAWADEEGNYINEAEELREILHDVLEYFSCDYQHFKIVENNEKFLIQIQTDKQSNQYEIKVDPTALADFLNHQAQLVDRPDKFDIQSKAALTMTVLTLMGGE
jgi:predicted RNA-binding protein YlqC (UPF0109 family)